MHKTKQILKIEGGFGMKLDFEKIRVICARKCLNMGDVLKAAKMSTFTGKKIRENKEVRTKTAGKLAAALGVDVTEIMTSA